MKLFTFSFFFFLFLLTNTYTQESLSYYDIRTVYVQEEGKDIKASILKEDHFFIPEGHLTYHCFYQNQISRIQGSYTGLLLSGRYEEFNSEKQLLQQGHFRLGLKHGRWKEWHDTGKLKKVQYWKNGLMEGNFVEYDEEGKSNKRGIYKNDKLHGKVVTIEKEGEEQAIRYKNGEEKGELFSFKLGKKGSLDKKEKEKPKKEKKEKSKKKGKKKEDEEKKGKKRQKSTKKERAEVKARKTNYYSYDSPAKPKIVKGKKNVSPSKHPTNDQYKDYFSRRVAF